MLEPSIQLGRILGIRVGVHYTWFIIFALISFSLSLQFQEVNPQWGPLDAWGTAIVTALLFFASIVLHELGHSVVAMAHGIPVVSITLFIFGGVAQTGKDTESAKSEFWIAVAGPLVSLSLALVFFLLNAFLGQFNEHARMALRWLSTINFLVAVFNLLPGFPLDGGRVFRAVVWGITKNADKGMRWAVNSGRLVAYGLMVVGFIVIVRTGYVIDGVWIALIGWFLLMAAEASGRHYILDHLVRGGRAQDVMLTDVPLVPASLSVQDWLDDYVLARGERSFLVRENEHIIGLISLSDCKKIPRAKWTTTGITEIMTPRQHLHTVRPQTSLSQVMQAMERFSVNQVPVAQNEQVLGWIDRDRLLKALKVRAEISR